MDIQILQLVVPSVLTVIGWLMAAWWAIEQVKTAHEKNIELQRELLNESYRRDTARELIEIYKSITQSANNLRQAIFTFWLNHTLEKGNGQLNGINIKANHLVTPINDSYNATAREFERLDMWLKVAGDQVLYVSILKEAISDFHSVFSVTGMEEEMRTGVWVGYQGLLTSYQSGNKISEQKLESHSREITEAVASLISKLTDGTAKINRGLCGTTNNA